jgi:hypothetical protein
MPPTARRPVEALLSRSGLITSTQSEPLAGSGAWAAAARAILNLDEFITKE